MKDLEMPSVVSSRTIPRQTPKSGKFWKCERSKFGNIKRGPRRSFEQRIKIKEEQMKTNELAKLLIDRKAQKKRELRYIKLL